MTRALWKYELRTYSSRLLLPAGGHVRHFAIQRGIPCIWVEVDPDLEASQERTFRAVATGEPFDDADMRYLATTLTTDGCYVWHLYEVIR